MHTALRKTPFLQQPVKTETNPNAPDVVLPRRRPDIQRWAELFRDQRHPVPIFLKRRTNVWKCVGDYHVERWTEDHTEIALHAKRAGRSNVTSVLFLRRHDLRYGAQRDSK
jgi:hypothetical protein